jgi:hypothetical protein
MKTKFFLGVFVFSVAALAQEKEGISKFFNPESAPNALQKAASNQLAKSHLGLGTDLIDLSTVAGVIFNFKIRSEVEPSTIPNVYQRTDRYTLNAGIRPFDLLDNNPAPFGFSLNRNTEVTFVRSFSCDPTNEPRAFGGYIAQCQKEAIKQLPPYKLSDIPYTSWNALKLKYGDFVSFRADLNLIVDKSMVSPLAGFFSLNAYSYYLIQGEFMVHTFKLKDNRIRVRFIAHRGRTAAGGIQVIPDINRFHVFGVKILTRGIFSLTNKVLDLTPLDIGISKQMSDVFLVDYIFDLSKPGVVKVFDDIMGPNLVRLDLRKIANPISKFEEVAHASFKDLTPAEDMFQKDKDLPVLQRGVDRVFKGSNYAHVDASHVKIGFNFLKFESGTTSAETKVAAENDDGTKQHFLYSTYSPYFKTKYFFGVDGTEQYINASLLFETDDDYTPTQFSNLIMTRDTHFRAVSNSEFNSVKVYLRELLPPVMLKSVAWKEWNIEKKNFFSRGAANGQLHSQIWIKASALTVIHIDSADKASHDFEDFIKSTGRLPTSQSISGMTAEAGSVSSGRSLDNWFLDINTVGARLYEAFNPNMTPAQRYESFMALKNIPLFIEFGAGFLLRLIPENELSKHVAYNFVFGANGQPPITGNFGTMDDVRLQKSLESIQNEINDRSFDLRLYLDENGKKSRTKSLIML